MKKLFIKIKAKRYDKAIERAEGLIDFCSDSELKTLEYVFPELKESKDEKIKKVIYGWIYTQPSQFFDSGFSKEEMLAWIEKQGEQKATIEMKSAEESLGIDSNTYNKIVDECIYSKQKSDDVEEVNFFDDFRKTDSEVEPKFHEGDNIEPIDSCLGSPLTIYKICDGFYETNQGTLDFEFENNWRLIEQKSAWSEEDETKIKSIIALLKSPALCTMDSNKGIIDESIKYLKSLKDRVQPQQEWSEENKRIYRSIMYSFAHNYPLTIQQQEFVKSFKERYTWKPNEEQMRVLDLAIRCGINRGTTEETTLVSLFNDLKKLI